MTKITSFDLTPFYRNTVGIDALFDRITSQIDAAAAGGNYPPYDILKLEPDLYEIRLAVAGFGQDEIDVEHHEGRLTITGRPLGQAQDPGVEYLHAGIAHRSFQRIFTLADYVEVRSARIEDGILTVRLQRIIPESMKPKKIEISYQKTQPE